MKMKGDIKGVFLKKLRNRHGISTLLPIGAIWISEIIANALETNINTMFVSQLLVQCTNNLIVVTSKNCVIFIYLTALILFDYSWIFIYMN